jgi:ferritin-like metal-binding protein YciE
MLEEKAMSHEAREVLIVGLRNAHAVESQAVELLERQVDALEDYPDVQSRVRQHLGETRSQLARLEDCLDHLGERRSAIKDVALSTLGNFMAITNSMTGDAVLKNSFASYSFEHYEIAAYQCLLELAELADEAEIIPLLQQNLAEERSMAEWLASHVRPVTRDYIRRRQQKDQAA